MGTKKVLTQGVSRLRMNSYRDSAERRQRKGKQMTDGSRFTEAGNDGGTGYERSSTGIPRWAKVTGIVAAIVVLVIVILAAVLSGGGDDGHSPRRHSVGIPQISPTAVETGVPLA
jgi:hypothetical protein